MNAREKPSPEAIEACIARVLDAERQAQAAIASAEGHAAATIVAARQQARAIAECGEARLKAARQSVDARIASHRTAAERESRAVRERAAPAGSDDRALDAALARVAASLTTGSPP